MKEKSENETNSHSSRPTEPTRTPKPVIELRAIDESDLDLMCKWRNSEHVRPYVREYRLIGENDQYRWFEDYLKRRRSSEWGEELMIVEYRSLHSEQLVPVGVGGFVRIQWRNRRSELSFYIGEDAYRTHEVIVSSLRALMDKGFKEWGFHKLTWPVYGHDPNLKIYKEVLVEEATLHEEYLWNGQYYDRHYLSMLK